MGSNQHREQQLAPYQPQMQNYTLAYTYSPLNIYRHIYNNQEIMQFKQKIYHSQDIDRKLQTFSARYQHIYLVSALYLQLTGTNTCGSGDYQLSIYYERVVTNLSKVNDIPFSDSLHCLAVALKGFQILFKNYGYFQVFEDMFHICQRGKLKVWCNKHIYKNVPEQYLLGGGREQDMVLKILTIIDQNTDPTTKTYNLRGTLTSIRQLTFTNTIAAFRQICRQNQFTVTQHLQSLTGVAQIQNILDIYVPQPRQTQKDTAMTFYPKRNTPPSKTTQQNSLLRSRGNSSSGRNKNNLLPSQRGRSLDISGNKRGFQLTSAHQEFPNFIVRREKAPSIARSRRSPHAFTNNANNIAVGNRVQHNNNQHLFTLPTSHLQQFRTEQPLTGSRLKKKNIINPVNQQPIIHFQNRVNQQQPIIYNNNRMNAGIVNNCQSQHRINPIPANSLMRPNNLQSPSYNNTTSQPSNQYIVRQQQQYTPVQRQPEYIKQTPQYIRQPPAMIETQYINIPQQSYYNRTQQPIQPSQQRPISQPHSLPQSSYNHLPNNQQNYISNHIQPIRSSQILQESRRIQQRGSSLPVKVTYAPIENKPSTPRIGKEVVLNHRTSKDSNTNQNIRIVTMGEGSAQKTGQFFGHTKEEKFNMPQMESKIDLLSSFADNRITTNQFLPNQSHALSNIKWEKNSNSGRDSVSSAFRKDFLQLSNKPPSKRVSSEDKKQDSYGKRQISKYNSKFDYNLYQTDPRLLELIKSTTNNYKKTQLTKSSSRPEQRISRFQTDYFKKDRVKQNSTQNSFQTDKKSSQADKPINEPFKNITQSPTQSPTFGNNDGFKRKPQVYCNRIPAISQNWEQQNICSISNGSRAVRNLPSGLDQDILEDMMHFRTDYQRKGR